MSRKSLGVGGEALKVGPAEAAQEVLPTRRKDRAFYLTARPPIPPLAEKVGADLWGVYHPQEYKVSPGQVWPRSLGGRGKVSAQQREKGSPLPQPGSSLGEGQSLVWGELRRPPFNHWARAILPRPMAVLAQA